MWTSDEWSSCASQPLTDPIQVSAAASNAVPLARGFVARYRSNRHRGSAVLRWPMLGARTASKRPRRYRRIVLDDSCFVHDDRALHPQGFALPPSPSLDARLAGILASVDRDPCLRRWYSRCARGLWPAALICSLRSTRQVFSLRSTRQVISRALRRARMSLPAALVFSLRSRYPRWRSTRQVFSRALRRARGSSPAALVCSLRSRKRYSRRRRFAPRLAPRHSHQTRQTPTPSTLSTYPQTARR